MTSRAPRRISARPRVNVDLIAVPYDSGRRDFRMGRGPARLFSTGIVEALERLGCIVSVCEASLPSIEPETEIASAFALQTFVAERVAEAKRKDSLPIILSGNCNTATGTIAGLTATCGMSPRVMWLDAHADFNTPESTTTGFLDGMAVSMLAGRSWTSMTSGVPGFKSVDESRILMIGVRDVDALEQKNLDGSRICRLPSDFADADLSSFISTGSSPLYLHVDMDVFDITEGRANTYAVGGGLSRETFMRIARAATGKGHLGAAALTAYDPDCDPDNRIARLAVDIAVALATGTGLEPPSDG